MAYPLASAIYSAGYTVQVEQARLATLRGAQFRTHTSIHAERLHQLSETLSLPARWSAQLAAHIIQPLPGENKDHPLLGACIRISCIILWVIIIPLAVGALVLAIPLRLIDHHFRPAINYIDNSASPGAEAKTKENLLLTPDSPLHLRTHNVGFVTSCMSIVGDLRPPAKRAEELVQSIVNDPAPPDIIFFQETFHEDATRVLCEGIKTKYPYIIHSVAPQITGFNSGALVASKYPIENVEFQRLNHMLGPEKASPRGIIKVRLDSNQGPILLYGIHTQALIGEERARARLNQLQEVTDLMQGDADAEPGVLQILMGDFNTSRVTAWGDNNAGQAEQTVMNKLDESFDDVYLKDHHPLTGARTEGNPSYLEVDNGRLNEGALVEPSGSWYHGPFADPGLILSTKMRRDRQRHGRADPQRVEGIQVEKSTWGTPQWHSQQTANTARFDYILLPKEQGEIKLDGRVEIRRVIVPPGTQSASSDHLPVDGKFWVIPPRD